MSTAIESPQTNGHATNILQPRPRRIVPGGKLDAPQRIELPSNRATPVPDGAPPSAHATSFARKAIRQQRKRLFPTVQFEARVSHFDPRSEYRDFRGFFVLFWIGLAIMVITTMLRNVKDTGFPFQLKQRELFLANIYELGVSDFALAASTMVSLPLHKLYANGPEVLRWSKGGIWIQSVYQGVWLVYWVQWPFFRNWTWTAQVFFTLHLMALLMKMHSYAFYNGHLSEARRRLEYLDQMTDFFTLPASSPAREKVIKYPTAGGALHELKEIADTSKDVDSAATSELSQLREDLAVELTSPLGHVTYPENVTVLNFVDFLCCPTLCYELEYPRTEKIHWMEFFYKALAVFGCIFLMTITSEEFIIPVLEEGALRLAASQGLAESLLVFAETISRLLFPFMVTFLLVFLVIFEYVCGAFAELTCFADRHFYDDWWNSCDWLEFSREWNIPVHLFFRRHVYAALSNPSPAILSSDPKKVTSPSSKKEKPRPPVSRPVATVITFLISAIAHEIVLACITKKLRGYGAFMMMLQIPIVTVQRMPWVRGRTLLNNVLFWCSMILGLSMICSLYVLL